MGDQPQLPKSLENMVVQEYRKEKARERLRRKMEQKKVSPTYKYDKEFLTCKSIRD